MKNLFFEKINCLIVFCLFFKKFVPKTYFLKILDEALFLWILWVFFLGFPNQKMTSATLNTSFHIDLGMFVGDWTHIIQILKY
jgi:hypothetical protein